MSLIFLLSLLVNMTWSNSSQAPCQIIFARHAETKYNLTGKYYNQGLTSDRWIIENNYSEEKRRQRDQRAGILQVNDLSKALKGYKFDKIIVSPVKRARLTLLDYLIQYRLKASVWPELKECCWSTNDQNKGPLARSSSIEDFNSRYLAFIHDLIPNITLEESKSFYQYDSLNDRYGYTNVKGREPSSEGDKLVELAVSRVKKECTPNKKILILGHSMHGKRFIEKLSGKSVRIFNTGVYLLTQKRANFFNLVAPSTPSLEANQRVLSELIY